MNRLFLHIFSLVAFIIAQQEAFAQYIPVKDTAFARFLCESYPEIMSADCIQLDTVQAKSITGIMQAENRNIAEIPELQYFHSIGATLFSENNISELPDMDSLSQLWYISFNSNQLSGTIDLSACTTLKLVILNNNNVSHIEGLSQLPELGDLQINTNRFTTLPDLTGTQLSKALVAYNYLTFSDLYPIAQSAADGAELALFPQFPKSWDDSVISVRPGQEITLTYDYDHNIPGLTYDWHFKGEVIRSGTENNLTISPLKLENAGRYKVIIKSDHERLQHDSIESRPFFLKAERCPFSASYSLTDQQFCDSTTAMVSCAGHYSLAHTVIYENTFNGKTTESQFDSVATLQPGIYTVYAQYEGCSEVVAENIELSFKEDCEHYFTPNGDGINDGWFIDHQGIVKIVNAQGALIKELLCPAEWDGTTNTNTLAPDGKYLIIYSDGKASPLTLFK